jgi:hypothetical protein
MGTVNVLEALRLPAGPAPWWPSPATRPTRSSRPRAPTVRRIRWGVDPYSASKGAAEIAIASYRRSFFGTAWPWPPSGRGNVIGGAGTGRRIGSCRTSCARCSRGEPGAPAQPQAVRPWQHVLGRALGYLELACALLGEGRGGLRGAWNFGPEPGTDLDVESLAERILQAWGGGAPLPGMPPGRKEGRREAGTWRSPSTRPGHASPGNPPGTSFARWTRRGLVSRPADARLPPHGGPDPTLPGTDARLRCPELTDEVLRSESHVPRHADRPTWRRSSRWGAFLWPTPSSTPRPWRSRSPRFPPHLRFCRTCSLVQLREDRAPRRALLALTSTSPRSRRRCLPTRGSWQRR